MSTDTIDSSEHAEADKLLQSVTDAVSDIGLTVSRATYTSAYFIAYAAVFSALFVARAVPKGNAVIKGFADGGRAAKTVQA
jgi:hypothetical protein